MKIVKLLEFINENTKIKYNQLTPRTYNFLSLWLSGDSKALRLFDDHVKNELSSKVSKSNKLKLMRGIRFDTESEAEEFLGVSFDKIKRGLKVKIKYDNLTSWTNSPDIAKQFSNYNYDRLEKRWISNSEFLEFEYEQGDLIGIGILLYSEFNPKDILIQCNNLAFYKENEHEVICLPGLYNATIMKIDSYIFSLDEEEIEMSDDPLIDNNDLKKEYQNDKKIIEELKKEISSGNYGDLELKKEILIRNKDFAVSVIFLYPNNDDLIDYIVDNMKKLKPGNLKWMTIKGAIDMAESLKSF